MTRARNNTKSSNWQGPLKTQCVHRKRLRPFVPQDETDDIQVNQKYLYPDGNAVEDADILDENLRSAPGDASDDETTEEKAQINYRNEMPTFSDCYVQEVVARRTAIKRDTPLGTRRQTLARFQHPPMEIKTTECCAL